MHFLQQKTLSSKETNSKGRQSLFAQQFAATGGITFGVPQFKTDNLQLTTDRGQGIKMTSNATKKFSRSSLISGEGLMGCSGEKMLLDREVEEIHTENLAKLESMTQDEIMEEQARLKSSLGEWSKTKPLKTKPWVHAREVLI